MDNKWKLRIYRPALLDFGERDFQYTCRKDFKKYPALNGIFVGTEIKPTFPHPTKKELRKDKEFYPIFTWYYFPSAERELLEVRKEKLKTVKESLARQREVLKEGGNAKRRAELSFRRQIIEEKLKQIRKDEKQVEKDLKQIKEDPKEIEEILRRLPQIYKLDHWYLDSNFKKGRILSKYIKQAKEAKKRGDAEKANVLRRLVRDGYNKAKDLLDQLFLDAYFENRLFDSEDEGDYRNAIVNRFRFLLINRVKFLVKRNERYIKQAVKIKKRWYIDTYFNIKAESWIITAEAVKTLLEKLKKIVGCPMNELVGRPLSPLEIKKQIGETKSFQGVVRKDKEAKELFRFEDLKEVERGLKEKRKKQLICRQSFYRGRRGGSLESIRMYMKYQGHILHILPVFVGIAKNVIADRFRKVKELKEIPYEDGIDYTRHKARGWRESREKITVREIDPIMKGLTPPIMIEEGIYKFGDKRKLEKYFSSKGWEKEKAEEYVNKFSGEFLNVERLSGFLDIPLRTAYFYLRLLPPEEVINPLVYIVSPTKRDSIKPRFLIKEEYAEELKKRRKEKIIHHVWIKYLMAEKEIKAQSSARVLIHRWIKKGVRDRGFFYTKLPSRAEAKRIEQEYKRLDKRLKMM